MAVMTTTFLSSYWVGLAVGGAIGAVLALILAVILFLPDVKEKKVRLGKKN